MSAAGSSAASGAASGAAAGSVLGPWGMLVGGAVGGVSGYLKGAGADKKAKAQAKALEALRAAESRYSGTVQDIAGGQEQLGREVTLEGQQRLGEHVGGFAPRDWQAAASPAAQAFGGRIQQGMGPAPTGAGSFPARYQAAAYADALARAQAGMQPAALQHGMSDIFQAEELRRLGYEIGNLPDQRRLEDSRGMGAIRRGMAYEDYARALQAAQLQGVQAERAGSSSMLAGGLLDAGMSLAGGFAMGGGGGGGSTGSNTFDPSTGTGSRLFRS